jgi:prepilin-type N-terminal cleavage/methylation domain-containing protein
MDAVRTSLRTPRSEAGVTLIEVMVTIAIMGIAFTALLASLLGIFKFGDQHRQLAVAETLVRRYGDSVDNAAYVNCATAASYAAALTPAPPSGYSVQITAIEYWNGDANVTFHSSQATCTSSGDKGSQRVTVRVSQTGVTNGVVDDVTVVKRSAT